MSLFSLHDDRGPGAAIEISGHRISGVRLDTRGADRVVAAHATEAVADGMLVPSLTSLNVHNRAGVVRALTRVLEAIGRPRRIGLVVPDPVAKISMVKFQHVPAKAGELDQLVRWQIKKTSPFPLEEAQVTYAPVSASADGQEFLVSVARRDVIAEYESICEEAGAYAGLVDLSTTNVVNAVLAIDARRDRDVLVVNVAREWASLAVIRAGQIALIRSRAADGGETLADLVHQTAMYYEDRLGGTGFAQVLLCGATANGSADGDAEALRRSLETRLSTSVSAVDPTAIVALADRTTASTSLLDALTPSLGLLLRSRKVAA